MKKRGEEPDFMRDLHEVRVRLAKKWKNLSSKEIVESINREAKEFLSKRHTINRSGKIPKTKRLVTTGRNKWSSIGGR